MATTKSNWGGYREGAGPKPKLEERVKLQVYTEREQKEQVMELADQANEIIRTANEGLSQDDQDELASASELARRAVQVYLDTWHGKYEKLAKSLRPYLGEEKEGFSEPLEDGVIFAFYTEAEDSHRLEDLLDATNIEVKAANRKVDKKFHQSKITKGELLRDAIDAFLETYEFDVNGLVKDIRPNLGQAKP